MVKRANPGEKKGGYFWIAGCFFGAGRMTVRGFFLRGFVGVFPLKRRVPIVEGDRREYKGRDFSSCKGFFAVEERELSREESC